MRKITDNGRVKANVLAVRIAGSALGVTALAVVLGAPAKWG